MKRHSKAGISHTYESPESTILTMALSWRICQISGTYKDDSGNPGDPGEDPYPNDLINF